MRDGGPGDAQVPMDAAAASEPTWGGFGDPQACGRCHPGHLEQWRISPHAYAAVDPVFAAMVRLGQRQTRGELGQLCTGCHTPYGVQTGQTPVRGAGTAEASQSMAQLGPIAAAGVSCDVCHTAGGTGSDNGALDLEPDGPRRAGIRDPVPTDGHGSVAAHLQQSSSLCAPCHDVTVEGDQGPLRVEATFSEWLTVSGVTPECQGCHMPTYRGPAAVDGPDRELHSHTFVGVDVSLLPPEAFPGYERLRALSRQLLQEESVRLHARGRPGELVVSIENLAGHALPSGATVDRQMWLEVRVWDAAGREVFASGTLDARGDLRDDNPEHTLRPGTDPQLVLFRQRLYALDEDGTSHEVHFAWRADQKRDHLIPPLGIEQVRYDLSSLPPGDYQVAVRLRFRAFPPYLLRLLEREAGLSPDVRGRLPTVDMARRELSFSR